MRCCCCGVLLLLLSALSLPVCIGVIVCALGSGSGEGRVSTELTDSVSSELRFDAVSISVLSSAPSVCSSPCCVSPSASCSASPSPSVLSLSVEIYSKRVSATSHDNNTTPRKDLVFLELDVRVNRQLDHVRVLVGGQEYERREGSERETEHRTGPAQTTTTSE